jgi:hypothetical protein
MALTGGAMLVRASVARKTLFSFLSSSRDVCCLFVQFSGRCIDFGRLLSFSLPAVQYSRNLDGSMLKHIFIF